MAGGFIAFRCSNYESTAEREQFRYLCNVLKDKYQNSDTFCLLIGNINIYDSEFDAILVKHDAIIAVEFKNYGGNITATENGDWTADEKIIKGGSRKTVYQQARINHVALRNGLRELGLNKEWIKDIPSLIVFNQEAIIENQLSGKVKSWLYITDNIHFCEKIEDITTRSTDLSNVDIIDFAIKLNLEKFIDKSLSSYHLDDTKEYGESNISTNDQTISITSLESYNRKTPNHIFNLRSNQIFVFGTDTRGSQKYGAAGIANKRFGAKVGVTEGPTGLCYALPTRGFSFEQFSQAVDRLVDFIAVNSDKTFLIPPVGCGHAGFDVKQVASMFKVLLSYENVMLPDAFIEVYKTELSKTDSNSSSSKNIETEVVGRLRNLINYFLCNNISLNFEKGFELLNDEGQIVAMAEMGIAEQRVVFFPYNIQSEIAFRNNGYIISTPEEFIEKYINS